MEEYKKKIKETIDRFYVECVEEFKEAEAGIAADSRFRTMFRKKDYRGNIELLRACRKNTRTLRFPTGDIPKEDTAAKELIRQTERCIRQFDRLCDSYIRLQTALQKKASGEKISYGEYMDIYHKTQEESVATNQELKELDIQYTDFLEGEDYEVYEFL